MKQKFICFLLFILLTGGILTQAQTTYVPDDNFEQALIDLGYDGVLDDYVLNTKISGVTSLYVSSKNIRDLTGISGFTRLRSLDCAYNQLTSLDLTSNLELDMLYCYSNQIQSINIFGISSLGYLNCSNNQLSNIDVSSNIHLEYLYCSSNQLTSLDITNNAELEYLMCNNNQLTIINVNNNKILKEFGCSSNQLSGLDVSQNKLMTSLSCSYNILANLDLNELTALKGLWCNGNQLTTLDVSKNTLLTNLICYSNQLSTLNVSNNTVLGTLLCGSNQLTNLTTSGATALTILDCSFNQLTNLDLNYQTFLRELNCRNNNLNNLDVSNNVALTKLQCQNNQLTNLDLSRNVTLGTIYCTNNPLLSGLNVRNGNNISITNFTANYNPSLTCIQVDDEVKANTGLAPYNTWGKDSQARYAEDCLTLKTTTVNDDNFEQALIDLGIDQDGEINHLVLGDVSYITKLDVSDYGIVDLTGIEAFIRLQELSCNNNALASLNLVHNISLRKLDCSYNDLTSLDLNPLPSLEYLDCIGNELASLNVSQNSALKNLSCALNNISNLDLRFNPELSTLICNSNQLTSLDLSNNTKLYELQVGDQITNLDLSKNIKLNILRCYCHQLTSLDLTANTKLLSLDCRSPLTSIDLSKNLDMMNLTLIFDFPNLDLSKHTLLRRVSLRSDQLYSLNIRNGNNSSIVAFDVRYNPNLTCILVDNIEDINAGSPPYNEWLKDETAEYTESCPDFVDIEPPVLSGIPIDDIVACDNIPTPASVTAEDNFDGSISVTLSETITNGSCDNSYTLIRIWTATDLAGNTASTSQTITVVDTKPPAITCPADVTIACDESYGPSNTGTATAIDNCDNNPEIIFADAQTAGTCANNYTINRTWTATDACGNTSSTTQIISVVDVTKPVITGIPSEPISQENDPGTCGAVVTYPAIIATDNCSGDVVLSVQPVSGSFFPVGVTVVNVTARDVCGILETATFDVIVMNEIPVIESITAPVDPVQIGIAVNAAASFTDNNLSEAVWNWGDGTSSAGMINGQVITGDHQYTVPGVYVLSLTITDMCGETVTEMYQYCVIYDPAGGFVTGGGWIYSLPGAFLDDPLLEGKANFGFVSKYKKGATIPEGNTEFQFKAGNLKFNSYSYDWLVIAGSKAKFKGVGTINGSGTFGFMISAIDGDLNGDGIDKFRIKIWDEENDDIIIYDNELEQPDIGYPTTKIGAGSIVIHTPYNTKSTQDFEVSDKAGNNELRIYPNPFNNAISIDITRDQTSQMIIDLADMNGRVISILYTGIVEEGINYHLELDAGADLENGFYILRVRSKDGGYYERELILKQ